jgi:hypothetical protein
MLAARLGPETLDRLWIFPARIRGRTERGLVAASRYAPAALEGESDTAPAEERRRLYTAAYTAERTGKGLVIEHGLREEGEAPPDRLPRVMDGVVKRSGDELGDPREVLLHGDAALFEELMAGFDPRLMKEPIGES